MTIILSIGEWGGVYVKVSRRVLRLCLGWVALMLMPIDGDLILLLASIGADALEEENVDQD